MSGWVKLPYFRIFTTDFIANTYALTDSQVGKLVRAMTAHAMGHENIKIPQNLEKIFENLQNEMKKDFEKYQAQIVKSQKGGAARGRQQAALKNSQPEPEPELEEVRIKKTTTGVVVKKTTDENFSEEKGEDSPRPKAKPAGLPESQAEDSAKTTAGDGEDSPGPTPPRRSGGQTKKTRITTEFVPPDEWLGYAQKLGLSEYEAGKEFAKFRDHHAAKASAFADWTAAWRNWCRTALDIAERHKNRGFKP